MSSELIDVLDENGIFTGEVLPRDEVHKRGLWHRAIVVAIVNEKNEVLLQQRSEKKEKNAGMWDISVAGHISAGSNYLESALRELEEELGICAQPEDLQQAFMHLGYTETEFYGKPFKNAEISMVYVYHQPVNLETLKLQKEEVEEVCWMDYEKVLQEIRQEAASGEIKKYCVFLDEFENLGQWLRKNLIDKSK